MNFTDLLKDKKIDPTQVVVMRHRPWEKELNKVLPWLAAERPDLFNAFQQTQNPRIDATFQKAKYLASFMGRKPGKALFVGLYKINGSTLMDYEDCQQQPSMIELKSLGMGGDNPQKKSDTTRWFDLSLDESFYPEWKGRLVVKWPSPERVYCRRAHTNDFPVLAIHENSVLDAAMPSWDALISTWDQLRVMPEKWKEEIKRWRGVYFIFDESDGKGYVGSACGEENIYSRWEGYGKTGHGGNKLLKDRDPKFFRYSVLQLVAHDTEADAVVKLEASWKRRLHTRAPFGLNEN